MGFGLPPKAAADKKILKHLGLWEVKARPPSRFNPSPQKIHIAYSARLVRFVYLSQLRLGIIPNVTFCVYSAGDRSGPGILRLQFQRIVFTLLSFPEGTLFNKVYCYSD